MTFDRNLFDQLPRALRIEIEENAQRKGLTQSELARQQQRILAELRRHTAPGTRTDLANPATSAKSFAQVKRATALVGRLYGESPRQVEKRVAVLEAAESEPRFAKLLAEMDRTNKVNHAHAELQRIRRRESEVTPNALSARVVIGDIRELWTRQDIIPNASVALISTDPPWPQKYVALFGYLAQFGQRTLIDGGNLVTQFGHATLPEVLALMTPHLQYKWLCAVTHFGQHRSMPHFGVISAFHPFLWFTKGKSRLGTMVFDCRKSDGPGPKLTEHPWAQGESEARYYLERLSRVNSLVVDPFLGSGTIGIEALKLGRRFIGFEIDPETARKAAARIERETGCKVTVSTTSVTNIRSGASSEVTCDFSDILQRNRK